jgi:hypothetical protein
MKTIKNSARQGELYIDRVPNLPNSAKKILPIKGVYIVAHSESGHHHVIEEAPSVNLYSTDDPMVSYLEVIESTEETEALLRHLKSGTERHDDIRFTGGIYELRNQSEADSTPEGWRRAAD